MNQEQEKIKKVEAGDLESILEIAIAAYDEEDEACFTWYEKAYAIDHNNVQALNGLGNCYILGIGINADRDKGLSYYKKAAELGFKNAQYNYAWELAEDRNSEFIKWFERAAENGDSDAAYQLATHYLHYWNRDVVEYDAQEGFAWMLKAAEMGNVDAETDLGGMYYEGNHGIDKNYDLAFAYTREAAEKQSTIAASNMSLFYRLGAGVEIDIEKSIEWAIKAAELGDTDRIFQYASWYFNGENGMPEDRAKALEYSIIAADNGSITAMENTGICYMNGWGTSTDKIKAIEWFEKAAREDSSKAFYNLEKLYSEIDPQNGPYKYFNILKQTADNGGCEAMYRLHEKYRDGQGTEIDLGKAITYLQKAVDGEHPEACFRMAFYCMNGEYGVEKDQQRAIKLWEVAADKGNSVVAMENIAFSYESGNGAEKNIDLAIHWFERAAKENSDRAFANLEALYTKRDPINGDRDFFVFVKQLADDGVLAAMHRMSHLYEIGKGTKQNDTEARRYLNEAVSHNYPPAQFTSGLNYLNGSCGVEVNVSKALELIEAAADQGFMLANRNLGIYYKQGKIVERNLETAISYYMRAVQQGDISSMTELGFCYGQLGNDTESFRWYQKSAQNGDPDGKVWLADYYMDGKGTEIDYALAEKLYLEALEDSRFHNPNSKKLAVLGLRFLYLKTQQLEKAFQFNMQYAENGDADAQCEVGKAYARGEGTEQNLKEAVRYFKLAADQGNAEALFNLGLAYENGDGVEANIRTATDYYERAVEKGHTGAMVNLALCYSEGKLVRDRGKAVQLYRMAAKKDHDRAMFNLGICYENGDGVEKDDLEAIRWFEKAAEKGNLLALTRMAIKYHDGQGIPQDMQKGMTMLLSAVEGGCLPAKYVLGLWYREGEGVPTDYKKAEELFREVIDNSPDEVFREDSLFALAYMYATKLNRETEAFPMWKTLAERGNAMAQRNLGICYEHGTGAVRNLENALYWYSKAADQGDAEAADFARNIRQQINSSSDTTMAACKTSENSSGSSRNNLPIIIGIIAVIIVIVAIMVSKGSNSGTASYNTNNANDTLYTDDYDTESYNDYNDEDYVDYSSDSETDNTASYDDDSDSDANVTTDSDTDIAEKIFADIYWTEEDCATAWSYDSSTGKVLGMEGFGESEDEYANYHFTYLGADTYDLNGNIQYYEVYHFAGDGVAYWGDEYGYSNFTTECDFYLPNGTSENGFYVVYDEAGEYVVFYQNSEFWNDSY